MMVTDDQKMFRKFLETSFIISSKKKMQFSKNLVFFVNKSQLQFSKVGVFSVQKICRKFLGASVINSLSRDNSPYYAKKFQQNFEVEKNPTSIFKIGDFLEKKNQNPTR